MSLNFKDVTGIDETTLTLTENDDAAEHANVLVATILKGNEDVPDFCRIPGYILQYMLIHFPLLFVHILLCSCSEDKYAKGITFIRVYSWLSKAEFFARTTEICDFMLDDTWDEKISAEVAERWDTICKNKSQRVIEYFNRAWDMCLTDRCAE